MLRIHLFHRYQDLLMLLLLCIQSSLDNYQNFRWMNLIYWISLLCCFHQSEDSLLPIIFNCFIAILMIFNFMVLDGKPSWKRLVKDIISLIENDHLFFDFFQRFINLCLIPSLFLVVCLYLTNSLSRYIHIISFLYLMPFIELCFEDISFCTN